MSCFHTCLRTLLNHPLDVKIPPLLILKNSNPPLSTLQKGNKINISGTTANILRSEASGIYTYCFTLQIDTHNKLIILKHIWSVFLMHMFNIHLLLHCSYGFKIPLKSLILQHCERSELCSCYLYRVSQQVLNHLRRILDIFGPL